MADHLLAAGLTGVNLRALAAAAGTSDRMLLYYFTDKDELLAATLACIAARLTAKLDAAVTAGDLLRFAALLPAVWGRSSRRRCGRICACGSNLPPGRRTGSNHMHPSPRS